MARSYRGRGRGIVALIVVILAPLTFFAVLLLFEDRSADWIKMSLDGVEWETGFQGPLLDSPEPWGPGESRSTIVYVRNSGPDSVDATVIVACRSSDDVVTGGYLTITAQVDDGEPVDLPARGSPEDPEDVDIDDLGGEQVVPLTLTATLSDNAPIGTTLEGSGLELQITVTATRTEDSGPPSLLDATGPQLWLAPILLVAAATIALFVQARRTTRRSRTDRTGS